MNMNNSDSKQQQQQQSFSSNSSTHSNAQSYSQFHLQQPYYQQQHQQQQQQQYPNLTAAAAATAPSELPINIPAPLPIAYYYSSLGVTGLQCPSNLTISELHRLTNQHPSLPYQETELKLTIAGFNEWFLRPFLQGLSFGIGSHISKYLLHSILTYTGLIQNITVIDSNQPDGNIPHQSSSTAANRMELLSESATAAVGAIDAAAKAPEHAGEALASAH